MTGLSTLPAEVEYKLPAIAREVQELDVEYQYLPEYSYEDAEKVIRFIEAVCYVPEGKHSRRKLVLRPWQKSLILDVYRVDLETGERVTRHATLSIGRKNGKTALIAALMLAHLCGPVAQHNSELVSFALTREQAGLLFRYASGMVKLSHRLSDILKITPSKKLIEYPKVGSFYVALSAEAKSNLGKSPIVAFGDELGAFGMDRELLDSIMTGQGAHESPLMWILSTQARSDEDVLSEIIDYSKDNPDDRTYYTRCYNIEEGDDPFDEMVWYKANPALGDFLNFRDFRNQADKAKKMPGARSAFLNLRLNERIDAEDAFMSKDVWLKQSHKGVPSFEDLRDRDVSLGIDLAMRRDLAALVFCAYDEESDEITVVPAFFMPKEAVFENQERDKVNYKKWVEMDLLITPPGNSLDFEWAALWMIETVEQYNMSITSGGYDRYKYDHLMMALEKAGAEDMFDDVEPFGQGYVSMSPAVDILESYVYNGRLWHGGLGSPLLTWNISNCVIDLDPAGNRKITKAKSFGKIDGAIALAMALKTMDLENEKSYLDEEDSSLFLI